EGKRALYPADQFSSDRPQDHRKRSSRAVALHSPRRSRLRGSRASADRDTLDQRGPEVIPILRGWVSLEHPRIPEKLQSSAVLLSGAAGQKQAKDFCIPRHPPSASARG